MIKIRNISCLAKKPRDEFGGKLTAMEIQRCGPEILPAEIVSSLTSVLIRGGKVSNATYTGSQDPNEVAELIATTGGVPEPPVEGANPYFCAHLYHILSR